MKPQLVPATRAFINHKDKILIIRESDKYKEGTNTNLYDTPGGRMKPGQNLHDNLLREVKEESGLDVEIGKPFFVDEWHPTIKGEPWHIVGIFFECHAKSDRVILSQDHDEHQWIDPKKYQDYNLMKTMPEAFQAYLKFKNL